MKEIISWGSAFILIPTFGLQVYKQWQSRHEHASALTLWFFVLALTGCLGQVDAQELGLLLGQRLRDCHQQSGSGAGYPTPSGAGVFEGRTMLEFRALIEQDMYCNTDLSEAG